MFATILSLLMVKIDEHESVEGGEEVQSLLYSIVKQHKSSFKFKVSHPARNGPFLGRLTTQSIPAAVISSSRLVR